MYEIENLIKKQEKLLIDYKRWKKENYNITDKEIENVKKLIRRLKNKKSITVEEKDIRVFFEWLIKHKRSESGIRPTMEIVSISKKYDWLYSGFAYRGLKLYKSDDEAKKSMKKKIGDKIIYKKEGYKSWTKNKGTAIDFVVGNNTGISGLDRKIIIEHAKREGKRGIVIKGKIKIGIDIPKAINKTEKEATYQESLHYYLDKMPMFGSEGEIFGRSNDLVEIVDKINC
jgi:hypothetical protein